MRDPALILTTRDHATYPLTCLTYLYVSWPNGSGRGSRKYCNPCHTIRHLSLPRGEINGVALTPNRKVGKGEIGRLMLWMVDFSGSFQLQELLSNFSCVVDMFHQCECNRGLFLKKMSLAGSWIARMLPKGNGRRGRDCTVITEPRLEWLNPLTVNRG